MFSLAVAGKLDEIFSARKQYSSFEFRYCDRIGLQKNGMGEKE